MCFPGRPWPPQAAQGPACPTRRARASAQAVLLVALMSRAADSHSCARARGLDFARLRGGGAPGTACSAVCCQHNATANGDILPLRRVLRLGIPQICRECARRAFGDGEGSDLPHAEAQAHASGPERGIPDREQILDPREVVRQDGHAPAGPCRKQTIFVPEPAPEFAGVVASQVPNGRHHVSEGSDQSDSNDIHGVEEDGDRDGGEVEMRRRLMSRERMRTTWCARQRYTCALIRSIDVLLGLDAMAQEPDIQSQLCGRLGSAVKSKTDQATWSAGGGGDHVAPACGHDIHWNRGKEGQRCPLMRALYPAVSGAFVKHA
jgi:hypothetical protein